LEFGAPFIGANSKVTLINHQTIGCKCWLVYEAKSIYSHIALLYKQALTYIYS